MKDKEQKLIEAAENHANISYNKHSEDMIEMHENMLWENRYDNFFIGAKSEAAKEYHSDAVEFLKWVWLHNYTDNNFADELYEIFKSNKPKD